VVSALWSALWELSLEFLKNIFRKDLCITKHEPLDGDVMLEFLHRASACMTRLILRVISPQFKDVPKIIENRPIKCGGLLVHFTHGMVFGPQSIKPRHPTTCHLT